MGIVIIGRGVRMPKNKIIVDGLDRRLEFADFPKDINLNWDCLNKDIIPKLVSPNSIVSFTSPLLICGGASAERTTLACGIAAQQLVKNWRVKYMPVNLYIDMLRVAMHDDTDALFNLQHLKNDIEVFVWDNLVVGTYTEWEKTNLYQTMQYRIEVKGYKDIISTYFTKSKHVDFNKSFGESLYSLLFENNRFKYLELPTVKTSRWEEK